LACSLRSISRRSPRSVGCGAGVASPRRSPRWVRRPLPWTTGTSCASSRSRCCNHSIAQHNPEPSRQSCETEHHRGGVAYANPAIGARFNAARVSALTTTARSGAGNAVAATRFGGTGHLGAVGFAAARGGSERFGATSSHGGAVGFPSEASFHGSTVHSAATSRTRRDEFHSGASFHGAVASHGGATFHGVAIVFRGGTAWRRPASRRHATFCRRRTTRRRSTFCDGWLTWRRGVSRRRPAWRRTWRPARRRG
jgi:hypothetical protein